MKKPCSRKQPRIFLIDSNLVIGVNGGGLPYTQNNAGSIVTNGSGAIIPPVSPRVLILSSVGTALPAGVVSGIPSTNDFNAVWDWNDAGSALPASSTWSGWAGKSEELKVQRLNLSPLFLRLVLTTYSPACSNSSCWGRYSIDWKATNSVPINSSGIEGYFIQSSILGLHKHSGSGGALDSQQVLIRNNSFVYNDSVWRGSITGISPLGGLDVGSVVDKFLAANPNPFAPAGAQPAVVQSMMDYMDGYEAWAASNFTDNILHNNLTKKNGLQETMRDAVQNQYAAPAHYPPEVACPP